MSEGHVTLGSPHPSAGAVSPSSPRTALSAANSVLPTRQQPCLCPRSPGLRHTHSLTGHLLQGPSCPPGTGAGAAGSRRGGGHISAGKGSSSSFHMRPSVSSPL